MDGKVENHDLFGRSIYSESVSTSQSNIDIQYLVSGSYFIILQLENEDSYVNQFSSLSFNSIQRI